jgi:hypothetical protein
MNLDPGILVLGDKFERDRHQSILLQRRDLARVWSGNFDLRVRLTDDVEMRDRTEVVLNVSVDVDTGRKRTRRGVSGTAQERYEKEWRSLTERRGNQFQELGA